MKTLPIIKLRPEYYEKVEAKINVFFRNLFYIPIQTILLSLNKKIFNTKDVLVQALLDGKIQYVDGKITGSYSSKITTALKSLGAKFNKRSSSWSIAMDDMTPDMRVAIGSVFSKYEQVHKDLITFVDSINIDESIETFELQETYEQIILDANKQFDGVEKVIGVVPELTPAAIKAIAQDYANNMDLYIKDWAESNIKALRDEVLKNTFNGYRSTTLIKELQRNYGVSLNKARFLARQETSLLVSKFRESRYKEAGSEEYIWQTAGDNRVRDRHSHLNGQKFSWDNPPIIDEKGSKGHPGEDFGCRCLARATVS